MTSKRSEFRVEKDSLGEVNIPVQSYWGIRTARAQEQLFSAGIKTHPRMIESMVTVKKALVTVNQEMVKIDAAVGRAISQACDEVLAGKWRDQFVAEPFQSSASFALDININEVLANRAEELMGGELGAYKLVKPDRDFNVGQSRADILAMSMRLCVLLCLKEFEPVVLDLERILRRKALELAKSAKAAKNPIGEAAPPLVEQGFNAFGSAVERGLKRIKDMSQVLADIQVGAAGPSTAGGADPEFTSRLLDKLAKFTGLKLRLGEESGRSSQSVADFLHVSSSLKELAVELSKIANDLRQFEVGSHLPFATQAAFAGESANNAGAEQHKLNVSEALCAVAFQVIGNDLATALACQSAQPQLSTVSPMIVYNILQSIDLLHQSVACFNQRFLSSIATDSDRARPNAELGSHFFALLSEHVGLEKSRQLYEEFSGSSKEISEAVGQRNMVPPEVLEKLAKHSTFEKGRPTGLTEPVIIDRKSDDQSGGV